MLTINLNERRKARRRKARKKAKTMRRKEVSLTWKTNTKIKR
jgi:hypothetical protein